MYNNTNVAKTTVTNQSLDLVKVTGMKKEEIDIIKNTVAKNTTDTELAFFLSVAKNVGLSPLTKEIWCYKDGRNNMIMFAGRTGFLSIAQRNPNFKDLNSVEVCENDEFKMGNKDGQIFVDHLFSVGLNAAEKRGAIVGAYCVINLMNGGKIIEWADIKAYDKKQSVWNSHQAEMIKKVAEVHAIKKMSNLGSLYAEEEFKIAKGQVVGSPNDNTGEDNASKLLNKIKKEEKPAEPLPPVEEKQEEIVETEVEAIEAEIVDDKITTDEGDRLMVKVRQSGSKVLKICQHFKVESIYKLSKKQAEELERLLAQKIDAIEKAKEEAPEEVKVEEEQPATGIDKMKKSFEATKRESTLGKLPSDICKYLNATNELPIEELPEIAQQLRLDCGKGQFKGYDAYPGIMGIMFDAAEVEKEKFEPLTSDVLDVAQELSKLDGNILNDGQKKFLLDVKSNKFKGFNKYPGLI